MLRWQTERLGALAVDDSGWVVRVRPELVVEVAFDGVQTSPRYPGGVALRFARVLRYREDKTAAEADTIDTVRAIHAGTRLAHLTPDAARSRPSPRPGPARMVRHCDGRPAGLPVRCVQVRQRRVRVRPPTPRRVAAR